MDAINKSKGSTASERYLAKLCERAFLSLWSYPNLYTNEGIQKNKAGKELCDLLVVFDEHIIIFSDKNTAFSRTGDINIKWSRWAKCALLESARQIYGAEKWIVERPTQIYLDNKCKQPVPFKLSHPDTAKIHRVIVTKNSTNLFKQYGGGSGTLRIRPDIIGDAHLTTPFTVGQINPQKGFIHVLDDMSLDFILRELDTVTDFVEYLEKKEQFVEAGKLGLAAGEEELLAYYLRAATENNTSYFEIPEGITHLIISEGLWSGLVLLPQYIEGKKRDKISYVWDHLIEYFSTYVLDRTLEFNSATNFEEETNALQVMARENRIGRRILGKNINDLYETTPTAEQSVRAIVSPIQNQIGYVFLLLPKPTEIEYSAYRNVRKKLLRAYVSSFKIKRPELSIFVGIASEPAGSGGGSEDLMYYDATQWTEKDYVIAGELREKYGLLLDET